MQEALVSSRSGQFGLSDGLVGRLRLTRNDERREYYPFLSGLFSFETLRKKRGRHVNPHQAFRRTHPATPAEPARIARSGIAEARSTIERLRECVQTLGGESGGFLGGNREGATLARAVDQDL